MTTPTAYDFYWKRHDTAPNIQATLTTASGASINLTGATVKFIMTAVGGSTPKIASAGTLVNATLGQVQYKPVTGDTDTAGVYQAEWEVTFSDGTVQTFPDPGYLMILITADLESA